uniref:Uncharacterized protein n=1 Tax=Arundo donax TaxID=35708 RepID=A0A0A9F2D4_ARUDO
MVWWILTNI